MHKYNKHWSRGGNGADWTYMCSGIEMDKNPSSLNYPHPPLTLCLNIYCAHRLKCTHTYTHTHSHTHTHPHHYTSLTVVYFVCECLCAHLWVNLWTELELNAEGIGEDGNGEISIAVEQYTVGAIVIDLRYSLQQYACATEALWNFTGREPCHLCTDSMMPLNRNDITFSHRSFSVGNNLTKRYATKHWN